MPTPGYPRLSQCIFVKIHSQLSVDWSQKAKIQYVCNRFVCDTLFKTHVTSIKTLQSHLVIILIVFVVC